MRADPVGDGQPVLGLAGGSVDGVVVLREHHQPGEPHRTEIRIGKYIICMYS